MAGSLTSAQRKELKDAFDVFDTGRRETLLRWFSSSLSASLLDQSGKISQKELGSIFKALNISIKPDQLKQLVTEMDTDNSGMYCSRRKKRLFYDFE